jgi:hypothetical protein
LIDWFNAEMQARQRSQQVRTCAGVSRRSRRRVTQDGASLKLRFASLLVSLGRSLDAGAVQRALG